MEAIPSNLRIYNMSTTLTVIPIAALQHYMYCPRQCALIHVECLWKDNQATALGNVFHEKADSGVATQRRNKRIVRSLHIQSRKWDLSGIADIVEIVTGASGNGIVSVTPVEYKVGRPKKHSADEVQLCAQALCLEEVFGIPIQEGFLFYGKTKRQHVVPLDNVLRTLTEEIIRETRSLFDSCMIPAAVPSPSCRLCSLEEYCMPKLTRTKNAEEWDLVSRKFEEILSDENERELE